MIRRLLISIMGDERKRKLRRAVAGVRKKYVATFRRYGKEDLEQALAAMGVRQGDTVMVHANFPADSGFSGNPADLVDSLVKSVGASGNLMMVSIPFRGSAADYLAKEKLFDVNRTLSMMGLVSETFRRRKATVRSLHPTHPVLVSGKMAGEIIKDHNLSEFPCGPRTPFGKLHELGGKILFYDVSFGAITFFHYLEDMFKDKLPCPVYESTEYLAPVRDTEGILSTVATFSFRRNLLRDTESLERELRLMGGILRRKVGGSSLILVECEQVVAAMAALVERKEFPIRSKPQQD